MSKKAAQSQAKKRLKKERITTVPANDDEITKTTSSSKSSAQLLKEENRKRKPSESVDDVDGTSADVELPKRLKQGTSSEEVEIFSSEDANDKKVMTKRLSDESEDDKEASNKKKEEEGVTAVINKDTSFILPKPLASLADFVHSPRPAELPGSILDITRGHDL